MSSYPFHSSGIHFSEQLKTRVAPSVQEQILLRIPSLLRGNRCIEEKIVLTVGIIRVAIIVSPGGLVTAYKELSRCRISHKNRSLHKKKKHRSNGKGNYQQKGKKH